VSDLSQVIWRKASLSALNGGCVEVATNLPGINALRDSKRPEDGVHVVDRVAFTRFLHDVQGGRYDI
jgi:hypothetical protein